MCGICGVAGGDAAGGRELVERMCSALVHRGPDDQGTAQLDIAGRAPSAGVPANSRRSLGVSGVEGALPVTLGMRRLSIIDLEGGHQPMHNEDSTVWVVQNGEIYNHLELRRLLIAAGHSFNTHSDTEALVHGYEEWGGEMVERLNGMFAFAVLDRRRGSVLLARDRMGIKPLHYAIDGDRLVFASELKALLRDPALRKGIDPVALDDYLAYEFVPSPSSIVRGISKLQPGHTLTWSVAESSHELRRYWSPQLNLDGGGDRRSIERRRSLDDDCEELRSVCL